MATFTHSASAPSPGFAAVYLQRRDPARQLRRAAKVYSVGNDPVAVAIGDLDGDGHRTSSPRTMILASGAGVGGVSVLPEPGRAGAVPISAESHAVGAVPHDAAIGDLDGDGRPDLAVADSEGLSVLVQSPVTPGAFLPARSCRRGGARRRSRSPTSTATAGPDLLATNLAGRCWCSTGSPGRTRLPRRHGA